MPDPMTSHQMLARLEKIAKVDLAGDARADSPKIFNALVLAAVEMDERLSAIEKRLAASSPDEPTVV